MKDKDENDAFAALARFNSWRGSQGNHLDTLEGLGLKGGSPTYPTSTIKRLDKFFADANLDRNEFVSAVVATLDFINSFEEETTLSDKDYVRMEKIVNDLENQIAPIEFCNG